MRLLHEELLPANGIADAIAEKYLTLLKENKVKGTIFQQTNYITAQEKQL